MAHYTEDIISLCDRIMAACNRINKKLDVMDEQQRLFTYTDSYAPLQYAAPAYVTPGQTTAENYFHNQPTLSNDYHQLPQLPSQCPQLPPPKTYQRPPSTSPTTYQQLPLTSAATATSLHYQYHQPQPPNAHQPPPPYSHQPPPPPNTHQPLTPPYVPPRQTMAAPTAQCHNYPQPPLPYLQQRPQSYRQPQVIAAAAASLPHQNYQPDGQQPCTGKPLLGWPPPPPQHSLSGWSPPSHGRSAAPIPAAAVAISEGKIDSSLSGLILFGRFDREQLSLISVYGPQMKVHEGEGSDSSIFDAQIEYSCDETKNFDCSSSSLDSYDGAEASLRSFCDLQTRLSEISATTVSKTSEYMLHEEIKDAYASTCTAVSKIQPTPPPLPIFLPIIERDFKVLLQGNVHDRLDILKLRKMMNSSLLKEDRDGFYVDLHISNVNFTLFLSGRED